MKLDSNKNAASENIPYEDTAAKVKEILTSLNNFLLKDLLELPKSELDIELLQSLSTATSKLSKVSQACWTTKISVGDVVIVAFVDKGQTEAWHYPLIVSQVKAKTISATYHYENGAVEQYFIPFTSITEVIPVGDDPDFVIHKVSYLASCKSAHSDFENPANVLTILKASHTQA